MIIAEARVETERATRYLVQLCQHIGHIGDKGGQLHRQAATGDPGPEVHVRVVEASDTHGIVEFGQWGQCTMRATSDTLTLRVQASDEENLRRLQDALTRNLTRFGRRDHVEVHWYRLDEPGSARRRARGTMVAIILLKMGIIAVLLVLPSGLALSLGAGHAVALLVLLVAAVVTLLVHKWRASNTVH